MTLLPAAPADFYRLPAHFSQYLSLHKSVPETNNFRPLLRWTKLSPQYRQNGKNHAKKSGTQAASARAG